MAGYCMSVQVYFHRKADGNETKITSEENNYCECIALYICHVNFSTSSYFPLILYSCD